MNGAALPDGGLQPERTSLAWVRTGLALLLGAAATARVTADRITPVQVVLVAGAGVVAAAFLLRASLRPARTTHPVGGGALLVVASGCSVGAAVLAVLVLGDHM